MTVHNWQTHTIQSSLVSMPPLNVITRWWQMKLSWFFFFHSFTKSVWQRDSDKRIRIQLWNYHLYQPRTFIIAFGLCEMIRVENERWSDHHHRHILCVCVCFLSPNLNGAGLSLSLSHYRCFIYPSKVLCVCVRSLVKNQQHHGETYYLYEFITLDAIDAAMFSLI